MSDRPALIPHSSVLSIYPNSRGFAFVLFEGALAPFDWGIVEVRGTNRNRACVARVAKMLGRFEPAAVVLEHMGEPRVRRSPRIQDLNAAIALLADTQGVPTFWYSRAQVRKHFQYVGAPTKQYIAEVIAKHVPALERYLPPKRKIWKSEDARMGLFDAAALALTFFHVHAQQGPLGETVGERARGEASTSGRSSSEPAAQGRARLNYHG